MMRSIASLGGFFGEFAAAFLGLAGALATAPAASMAQNAASSEQVSMVDVDNTRNMRFCEVLVIDAGYVDIYNTSGLNACPEDAWNAIDPTEMAKEMGVQSIQKNGPHFWVMDSQTIGFGETKSFGGIDARWAARAPVSSLGGSEGSAPYKPFKTCKTQKMAYDAGQEVWEMVDNEGQVWILQAHEEQFSLDDLDTLDTQMKSFPDGWSWRTRTLDAQLVLDLRAADCNMGIGDEFHQYYTLEPSDG